MRALLVTLALLTCACGATLHRAAQASEFVAQGSLACDAVSTHVGMRRGGSEENPMLGVHPDDTRLGLYFGTIGGGVYAGNRLITHTLDKHPELASLARLAFNGSVLTIEVDAINNNVQVGIPLCGL